MDIGLSVDTNKVVTFQLGDDIFGIDIMAVREIIRLDNLREIPDAPEYFYGIINLRGNILPIINFKNIFGFTGFDFEKEKDVIICRIDDNTFGLVIDRVLKVEDYDKSKLGPPPRLSSKVQTAMITGVIKSENNLISLIDIYALFSQKGMSLLQYDKFNKKMYQTSLVEHYFTKKNKENLTEIFNKLEFPFNELTKKSVLEYIVKTSVKKETDVKRIIEAIKTSNNSLIKPFLFNKNKNKIIFYNDIDFLTLQRLILRVILPLKREKAENNFKFWIIGDENCSDAYSLLIILAVLFEEEFDIEYEVIASGEKIDKLNEAYKGEFKQSNLIRLTKSLKNYLFNWKNNNTDGKENRLKENKEEQIQNYKLKDEFKKNINFDLFFKESKAIKKDVDLIYAPNYFANLPKDMLVKNIEKFYKSLKINGILVCGYFEKLEDNLIKNFKTYMMGNRVYYVKEKQVKL